MSRFVTIVLLLLFAVLPATADLRIERTRTAFDPGAKADSIREWADTLFIGASGVRWDLPSTSTIVRTDTRTYVHIDHQARAYAEVPMPLKLEDLLTAEELECLRRPPLALVDLAAEVTMTGESRLIDRWKTTRLRVSGRHALGLEIEKDMWITHDLPVDLSLFFKMMRNKAALSPVSRAWYADLAAAGGFPVESTTIRTMRDRVWQMQQRLDSVSEIEPDPARYRPPAGYSPTLLRPPLDVACARPPPPPW